MKIAEVWNWVASKTTNYHPIPDGLQFEAYLLEHISVVNVIKPCPKMPNEKWPIKSLKQTFKTHKQFRKFLEP